MALGEELAMVFILRLGVYFTPGARCPFQTWQLLFSLYTTETGSP